MQSLSMFGQLRASRIAFTEPTRAASQQTLQILNNARSAGINVVRIWNTEKDRKVCEMCQQLDGLTDDLWESVYKGDQDISQGAPAHVNCRCDTGIDYVGAITQPAETPAEELTVDEATAPIPTPTQVPLLQRDAAEIAQHIIDAVPADLAADANDLETWRITKAQEMMDARTEAFNKFGYKSQEYADAVTAYQTEARRIEAIKNTIAAREETVYRTVLKDLQHPTPATANVSFAGVKLSKAQEARINDLIQLSVGISPDSIYPVNIVYTARGGADTVSGSMGRGVMTGHKNADAATIVHESMHALQEVVRYGIRATDDFAAARTAGEKPVSLRSQGYGANGNTYLDATDSAYTFRIYPASLYARNGNYCEVLTTAIDHLAKIPNRKDTGLLELFAQIVKDGGK
jgi:hypothetical protein